MSTDKFHSNNLESADYFEIIKDDLRNMRPLSSSQLYFVQNLNAQQLFEMIIIFNHTTKNLVHYISLS